MIIAYSISGPDNGSHMNDERKGVFSCEFCLSKLKTTVNKEFTLKKKKYDISYTYDGYLIVSEKFKNLCSELNFEEILFHSLPLEKGYYYFEPLKKLPFDFERRKTTFSNICDKCNVYQEIIGAHPVYLKDSVSNVKKGIYRTDLEFGQNHSRFPLVIVGTETFSKIKKMNFKGLNYTEVNS